MTMTSPAELRLRCILCGEEAYQPAAKLLLQEYEGKPVVGWTCDCGQYQLQPYEYTAGLAVLVDAGVIVDPEAQQMLRDLAVPGWTVPADMDPRAGGINDDPSPGLAVVAVSLSVVLIAGGAVAAARGVGALAVAARWLLAGR